MLRLTGKLTYKKVPGHRRVYKALEDLLVPGDGNLRPQGPQTASIRP
jgi:hypothetical protein